MYNDALSIFIEMMANVDKIFYPTIKIPFLLFMLMLRVKYGILTIEGEHIFSLFCFTMNCLYHFLS